MFTDGHWCRAIGKSLLSQNKVYFYVHDKISVAICLDGYRIYLRKLAKVRSTDPI